MKKLACTIAWGFCSLRILAAEEAVEPPAAPANDPSTVELKYKSSFALEESARSPFWPIGWKPAPIQNGTADRSGPDVQAAAFAVTSITVDSSGRFAIINGKVMTEGQVFGLQLGTQTYQITVKAIQDGQVILGRRDQEIAVPLRRR